MSAFLDRDSNGIIVNTGISVFRTDFPVYRYFGRFLFLFWRYTDGIPIFLINIFWLQDEIFFCNYNAKEADFSQNIKAARKKKLLGESSAKRRGVRLIRQKKSCLNLRNYIFIREAANKIFFFCGQSTKAFRPPPPSLRV